MAEPRRRNTILAGLDEFRDQDPGLCLLHIVSFLYICENEGLSVAELAEVMGATRATASRNARALTAADHDGTLPPSLGLVDIRMNPFDARGRILFLTEKGQGLRNQLDHLISLALPIARSVDVRAAVG